MLLIKILTVFRWYEFVETSLLNKKEQSYEGMH